MTPEQLKYVKPRDLVTTWHLLQDNHENAAFYASRLIKSAKSHDFKEKYWFPTPEDTGDPQHHTPIQKRILTEILNLQEFEKLNPKDDPASRKQYVINFDCTVSMLPQGEIARKGDFLVGFHIIFARHRFDKSMKEEFKVDIKRRFVSVQSKLTDAN